MVSTHSHRGGGRTSSATAKGRCWCVLNRFHCAGQKSNFPSTLLSSSDCRSDNDTDVRQNDGRKWPNSSYPHGGSMRRIGDPRKKWAVEAYMLTWAKEKGREAGAGWLWFGTSKGRKAIPSFKQWNTQRTLTKLAWPGSCLSHTTRSITALCDDGISLPGAGRLSKFFQAVREKVKVFSWVLSWKYQTKIINTPTRRIGRGTNSPSPQPSSTEQVRPRWNVHRKLSTTNEALTTWINH